MTIHIPHDLACLEGLAAAQQKSVEQVAAGGGSRDGRRGWQAPTPTSRDSRSEALLLMRE